MRLLERCSHPQQAVLAADDSAKPPPPTLSCPPCYCWYDTGEPWVKPELHFYHVSERRVITALANFAVALLMEHEHQKGPVTTLYAILSDFALQDTISLPRADLAYYAVLVCCQAQAGFEKVIAFGQNSLLFTF